MVEDLLGNLTVRTVPQVSEDEEETLRKERIMCEDDVIIEEKRYLDTRIVFISLAHTTEDASWRRGQKQSQWAAGENLQEHAFREDAAHAEIIHTPSQLDYFHQAQ